VYPQLFTATYWHQNERLCSDHIVNIIDITSIFHKAPGIHIPPRWITDKSGWDLFAKKLRTCCNELAEMNTTQIWRPIKKLKGHAKAVNPKVEAIRLADHFTTRADQTTLPKNIITAFKEQLPLR